MIEETVTVCIAPNCKAEAALDSALCAAHKLQLQKTEDAILKDATRSIRSDLRQFERLLYVEPQLHSAELSHRTALPMKEVRKLLKRFKDERA